MKYNVDVTCITDNPSVNSKTEVVEAESLDAARDLAEHMFGAARIISVEADRHEQLMSHAAGADVKALNDPAAIRAARDSRPRPLPVMLETVEAARAGVMPTQPAHPAPSLDAINNEIGFHLRALHALALRKREVMLDGVGEGETQAYIDAAAESLYSEGINDEWIPGAMWEYLIVEEIECILEDEAEESEIR